MYRLWTSCGTKVFQTGTSHHRAILGLCKFFKKTISFGKSYMIKILKYRKILSSDAIFSFSNWINSLIERTVILGKDIVFKTAKCLPSVTIKLTLPVIAQSEYLLSSGSFVISRHLKDGVWNWTLESSFKRATKALAEAILVFSVLLICNSYISEFLIK